MNGPINTYISAKRVSRAPNDARVLAGGASSAGITFVAAVTEGDRSALILKIFPERGPDAVLLRLDFNRLVDSLIGAEAAEAGSWEPLRQDKGNPMLWGNSILTAARHQINEEIVHISYHLRDRAPVRDWRIGQKIKNELCGEDWEAVELYPAEHRVVDTSNEYHLWCFNGELPFGFTEGERGTQAQIDGAYDGPGEGPMQTDDPDADTSSFNPDFFSGARYRVPQGQVTNG